MAETSSFQEANEIVRNHPRLLAAGELCILGAAFLSFLFSVYLWFSGDQQTGIFVGLWVPSILALGAYINSVLGGLRNA
jgi:hypothetical protein